MTDAERVKILRGAMAVILKWDMLNPPQPMSDFPWLKQLIEDALRKSK